MRARSALVGVMLLAACGGGDATAPTTTAVATTTTAGSTTTTTEPGFEVVSADGVVTVSVPAAAMAEDPGITISALSPEDYPAGLGAVADDPATVVYALGPDGTEFAAPVTVSFRVDAAALPDLAVNEVPGFVLFTTSGDGFEMYGDLTISRDGSEIVVSGSVSHFSPAVLAREASTAVVTLDAESIENVASARSVEDVLELLTEAPATIPVTAGFRGADGTPLAGLPTLGSVDGLPFTARGPALDITCADIEDVEVLTVGMSAIYGSEAVGGVVDFITTRELFPDSLEREVRFDVRARARCLDPTTSILGLDLTGTTLATDHPGGIDWIPDRGFQGGISATFVTAPLVDRIAGMHIGLICDNDRDGVVDPTDTMFPAYAFRGQEVRLESVIPLFDYADYFVYLVDGSQYSQLPAGTGWTVADGLGWYQGMYNGSGRFEASLGVVGSGGSPFVYTVDAAEPEVPLDGTRLEFFDLFRTQIRF